MTTMVAKAIQTPVSQREIVSKPLKRDQRNTRLKRNSRNTFIRETTLLTRTLNWGRKIGTGYYVASSSSLIMQNQWLGGSDRMPQPPRIEWIEPDDLLDSIFARIAEPRSATGDKVLLVANELAKADNHPSYMTSIARDIRGKISDLFAPSERNPAGTQPRAVEEVEFKPSDELLKIIKRGIGKWADELPHSRDLSMSIKKLMAPFSEPDISEMLVGGLRSLIASTAFRQAEGLEAISPLTRHGGFTGFFLNAFLDVFPIWPADLGQFERVMREDLLNHISSGKEFKDGWGKLKIVGGELAFELNKDTVVRLPKGPPRAPMLRIS